MTHIICFQNFPAKNSETCGVRVKEKAKQRIVYARDKGVYKLGAPSKEE